MEHEQRLIELERRRRRGARLLAAGVAQAEVARRVGVTRTSVSRWEKRRPEGGHEALKRPKRFGRPRKLSDAQCEELIERLKSGAIAAGFGTELWTLPRIRTLIEQRFAVKLTEPSVWRLLHAICWSARRGEVHVTSPLRFVGRHGLKRESRADPRLSSAGGRRSRRSSA